MKATHECFNGQPLMCVEARFVGHDGKRRGFAVASKVRAPFGLGERMAALWAGKETVGHMIAAERLGRAVDA
jgi:hypothetical protein